MWGWQMNKEKEESIIIKERDGHQTHQIIIVRYWKLLQGIEIILFILSLAIVPHDSHEYWKLWIAHILISLYIFYRKDFSWIRIWRKKKKDL